MSILVAGGKVYVKIFSEGKNNGLDLSGEFSCGGKDEGLSFSLGCVDSLQD